MKIALCIPHLPGIPKRDESFDRLMYTACFSQRETDEGGIPDPFDFVECGDDVAEHVCILTDKEPNHVWAAKMRSWWLETGADFCLTLQDDTLVSPRFWEELRAMLTHLPRGSALGLSSVHPMQTEIARQGLRWYQTRAWLVGWAWGMWREDLLVYDAWCRGNPERVARTNEDSMVNEWIIESGRNVWHPVPTIADHDTSIASTYANDSHVHRRPLVTWRDVRADLTEPAYWLPSGSAPPLLEMPLPHLCWFCRRNRPEWKAESGCLICKVCVLGMVGEKLGLRIQGGG